MSVVVYGEIARVLGGARRRQVGIVLLAAVGFGAAGAVLCLLAGAGALGWGARAWVRPVALAGAGVSALGAVLWAAATLLRTAWSDEAAARTVGAADPGLRSDLVSSVELTRERGDIQSSGRFSVALLDAHVARTAERARGVRLDEVVPARLALRALAGLGAVAALNLLLLVGVGAPLSKGYARLFARAAAAAPSLDPITGDIELTFRYPAYMRREPRTVSGTGGEIRAPKGTEVELHTRADRKVEGAEVEVTVEDPGTASPPSPRPSPPAPRWEREAERRPRRRGGARAAGSWVEEGRGERPPPGPFYRTS